MQRPVPMIALLSCLVLSCSQPEGESDVLSVPVLKEIEPFTYCAIEAQGSFYEDQQAEITRQLREEVERQNITVLSDVIGVWHTPYPKAASREDLRWEKGFIIPEDAVVREPLKKKRWDIVRGYSQTFSGTSDEAGAFWDDYWAWFNENQMKTIRPLLDIDLPHAETNEDGERLKKYEAFVQAVPANKPYPKGVEPFRYCAIEAEGSWSQHDEILGRLNVEIERQNIPIRSEILGIWYSYPDRTSEADLRWELGYRVDDGTQVEGPLVVKEWATSDTYSQVYDGPSSGVTEFFREYWAWFPQNNLEVVRPLMEIDLPHSATNENGETMSKFEAIIQAVGTRGN